MKAHATPEHPPWNRGVQIEQAKARYQAGAIDIGRMDSEIAWLLAASDEELLERYARRMGPPPTASRPSR